MEDITDRVTRSQSNKRDSHNDNELKYSKKKRKIEESEEESLHSESEEESSEEESEYTLHSESESEENNKSSEPDEEDLENCQRKITKNILKKIYDDISTIKNININSYLNKLEKEITKAENNLTKNSDLIERSSIELSNNIIRGIISDIRREYARNKKLNLKKYLGNKLELYKELDDLISGNDTKPLEKRIRPSKKLELDQKGNVTVNLMVDPFKMWKKYKNILEDKEEEEDEEEEEEEDEEEDEDEDEEEDDDFVVKGKSIEKNDLNMEFRQLIKDNGSTPKGTEFKYFRGLSHDIKNKYINMLKELKNKESVDKPKILKIVDLNTTLNNKSVIMSRYQTYEALSPYNSEYFKIKHWVNGIMSIPFGVYKEPPVSLLKKKSDIRSYLRNTKQLMDDAIYGHENAKKQILQIVAQTISNPTESGNILAIQGPPGVGKTALIQDGISKALDRPFEFISLGGATDASCLEGFDYTYEGSQWGKVVDVLMKSGCMNPVIFFDELDKVSETPKGDEIINILTHLTDTTQNHHFHDKFFSGIDFDLSQAIFIFSFNEEEKINKILKDRMYIIRTKGFHMDDKINIASNYLIPKLAKSIGYNNNDVKFTDDVLQFIIDNYTYEGGVRRLKESVHEIMREINLRSLNGSKLKNKKVHYPVTVDIDMVKDDIFSKRHIYNHMLIHDKPKVGLVNGLWASENGVGGITPVEAFTIPTEAKLTLELTGLQGDVMKESMKVAKTIAWNVIPERFKEKLSKSWTKFGNTGIHIHCPDGATPKDGPSAGGAITTCIISLLMGIPVNNKIAMTGEINLQGKITAIGGLEEKLHGSKKAGVELVLCPKENERDLNKIISGKNSPIDSNFKVIMIETIWDILGYAFMDNSIQLNRY